MKTMKWLLRREFWEHKGALAWAPLIVSALMTVLVGTMAAYGGSQGKLTNNITIIKQDGVVTKTIFHAIPAEQQQMMANTVADMYLAAAFPLMLMMAVIAFFYCLSAMHDERRDRSILFWKSLPVSDAQTVLSKVLTAAVVIPGIAVGSQASRSRWCCC